MKIAIIGSAYPYRGGIAAYSERLAKEFQDQGHDVTIYTFTLQYPSFLFPGKSQYSEDKAPEGLNIIRCINSVNPFNWLRVGRRIRKDNPELVIVRFWLPFMGPSFGTILRRLNKKQSKRIAIVDNIIPHESRPGDKPFTSYFVKSVDGFLAMSESVIKDITQFNDTKPRALSPHPLYDNFGHDLPKNEARALLGLKQDQKVLLFFGLIRNYKGLDLLIRAFADSRFRDSNYKLLIAGEFYADKATYLDLIKSYQIEDDILLVDEFIPDSEVNQYFSAADLVVQPYKSATQSGITQIAYHFNKPMVVTNVGGLPEMCPNGKVGYVVEPNGPAIAEAIIKFFNDTDQEEMHKNVQLEKKKYSWDIMVKSLLALKDQV